MRHQVGSLVREEGRCFFYLLFFPLFLACRDLNPISKVRLPGELSTSLPRGDNDLMLPFNTHIHTHTFSLTSRPLSLVLRELRAQFGGPSRQTLWSRLTASDHTMADCVRKREELGQFGKPDPSCKFENGQKLTRFETSYRAITKQENEKFSVYTQNINVESQLQVCKLYIWPWDFVEHHSPTIQRSLIWGERRSIKYSAAIPKPTWTNLLAIASTSFTANLLSFFSQLMDVHILCAS